jgi:UDP-glucuronate 4-epimerase
MKVLITGAIGFIGYHLTERLLSEGYTVIGIDNINSYYDVRLKYAKLPILGIEEENIWPNVLFQSSKHKGFKFAKTDITDRFQIEELFRKERFDIIINLAAQAGVQYSIHNPHTYIENNITGFINLIDAAKTNKAKHFIYASSSSVYGNREDVPFKETDNVDHPISLYAASKKANELIAHTYSHLYRLKTTGLRFFTVYGPWGRPDMAPYIFVRRISEGKSITVFNNGNMERDFTYVDDIVDGVSKVIKGNGIDNNCKIYNIGNSRPVNLNDFIQVIEKTLNRKAKIEYRPIRKGDVKKTFSDINELQNTLLYKPKVGIKEGIYNFVEWYKNYYNE